MASTSRWFVGSSKSRRLGLRMLIIANTILDFCRPDRHPMAVFCIFVSSPKRSSHARQNSSVLNVGEFGYWLLKNPNTVFSGSSCSALCWLYRPMTKRRVRFHVALVGEFPRHQFQQRGLPASVWTHQRDARVAVDADVEFLVQVALFGTVVRENTHRRRVTPLGSLSQSGNSNTKVFLSFGLLHGFGFDLRSTPCP